MRHFATALLLLGLSLSATQAVASRVGPDPAQLHAQEPPRHARAAITGETRWRILVELATRCSGTTCTKIISQ